MRDARAVFDAHAIRSAHMECAIFFFKYANLWEEEKHEMRHELALRVKKSVKLHYSSQRERVARGTNG